MPKPNPKTTTNQLIRQHGQAALAYIPLEKHAQWYRGWRTTARCVARQTLKSRLEKHVHRLRLRADISYVREIL